MPRDPVIVCSATFAWLSCACAVCSCCSRVATSRTSCAIAPTSMTAHCACAAGISATASHAVNKVRVIRMDLPPSKLRTRNRASGVFRHEWLEPSIRLGAVIRNQLVHARHLRGATGDHRELAVETLQIELAHDAVVRLLHEEH